MGFLTLFLKSSSNKLYVLCWVCNLVVTAATTLLILLVLSTSVKICRRQCPSIAKDVFSMNEHIMYSTLYMGILVRIPLDKASLVNQPFSTISMNGEVRGLH
jgi:hypothetical protein